jgi:hypothetical protein
LFSIPIIVSNWPIFKPSFASIEEIVERYEAEFHAPELLEAASEMKCFSVTVIGSTKEILLSKLTGIEFIQPAWKTVLLGATFVPTFLKEKVVGLTNIVGTFIPADDPLSQAIAFVGAVSIGGLVIIDSSNFSLIWENLIFCCDRLIEFELTFSTIVNVLVIGDEFSFDFSGIPKTSFLHKLNQICKIHFIHNDDSIDPHFLNIKTNSRPTSDIIPCLRKAIMLISAHWEHPNGLITAETIFQLSEKLRLFSPTDLEKAEWLCKLSADRNFPDAQFTIASKYSFDFETQILYLRKAADQNHP